MTTHALITIDPAKPYGQEVLEGPHQDAGQDGRPFVSLTAPDGRVLAVTPDGHIEWRDGGTAPGCVGGIHCRAGRVRRAPRPLRRPDSARRPMVPVLDALAPWLLAQEPPTTAVGPRPTVSPLTITGCGIYQAGKIWKYRGITAFRAPELYARGEHGWLDDYYGAAAALGANTLRVFAMWNNTKYWPHSRADYYDQLWDFAVHAKAAGFYVHLVCFCDQVDRQRRAPHARRPGRAHGSVLCSRMRRTTSSSRSKTRASRTARTRTPIGSRRRSSRASWRCARVGPTAKIRRSAAG